MEGIKKIVGVNLLILVIYMVIMNIMGGETLLTIGPFILVSHFIINLIISIGLFIEKLKDARFYLLSAFLVLLIGFPACFLSGFFAY